MSDPARGDQRGLRPARPGQGRASGRDGVAHGRCRSLREHAQPRRAVGEERQCLSSSRSRACSATWRIGCASPGRAERRRRKRQPTPPVSRRRDAPSASCGRPRPSCRQAWPRPCRAGRHRIPSSPRCWARSSTRKSRCRARATSTRRCRRWPKARGFDLWNVERKFLAVFNAWVALPARSSTTP